MGTFLSPRQIGIRIKKLRKQKELSQQDLAKLLDVSRSAMTQIELGNRNLSVSELMKLSAFFRISLDRFLSSEYEISDRVQIVEDAGSETRKVRVSVPELSNMKFEAVLLYILEKCAGKPNIGETALSKLLYFCDFNYYEIYEEHLTGAHYYKLPYGPVPQDMDILLRNLINKGDLQQIKTEYYGYPQVRYLPQVKANLKKLNGAEKEVIDRVIDQYSDWSASAISEFSHKDIPWKATETGQYIDYELAFYREPPFSVRSYPEDHEEL
jgi:transcriptional regulator with XRE-family HTH domain